MRRNLSVSGREQQYGLDMTLISATDLKGVITYVNRDFLDVAQFSADELLGQSHNIVRHPDMPPEAFADMWATLKAGKPWMGVVKNRCKNGDHYWVDAYVTPMLQDGKITGYESTRVGPQEATRRRAEELYSLLSKGGAPARQWPSLTGRLHIAGTTVNLGIFSLLWLLGYLPLSIAIAGAGLASAPLALLVGRIMAPLAEAAKDSRRIVDNPVMRYVYTGRHDEIGQLQLAVKLYQSRLRTVVRCIEQAARELANQASATNGNVEEAAASTQQQRSETTVAATAMGQMSETFHDVARSAGNAFEAARHADRLSSDGAATVQYAIGAIGHLSDQVDEAETAIQRLADHSESIGGVLDVIKAIAEQTNLLALNAAIEAARAGEQGRGFAVVADEVRVLAGRTQKSTQEIHHTIEKLREDVLHAVAITGTVRAKAGESVHRVRETAEALAALSRAVGTITDMNAQIASATEEQHVVAGEINRGIDNINRHSDVLVNKTGEISAASGELVCLARRLEMMVEQFGTA